MNIALARQKPVLLLFEDVHWADPTSLEVLDLRHLGEEMLVRAGYAYQTATDWHRQHPALPRNGRSRSGSIHLSSAPTVPRRRQLANGRP
jgi:hypothetical protein